MAIPDYQTIMLPLLNFVSDGKEHSMREVTEGLAAQFKLTLDEQQALLPSGRSRTFANRTNWARTYLKEAGLLEAPRRGYVRIAQDGKKVLAQRPAKIDVKFLEQFPKFMEFRARRHEADGEAPQSTDTENRQTPNELLETAYQRLRDDLAAQILKNVSECSPAFFERLVVDLLVAMGYGGSRKEAGKAIGRSGDEGIDGIINEDRLGLDVIYLQAKRWQASVGRPEIQKFAGALQGHRAKKGIFLTTSTFTREAKDYVEKIESKIVLIDGEQLAQLMIDHNVGVALEACYETKKIDLDYFVEE